MQKHISPKIVALTFGVLVISFLTVFYVVAWQEPTQAPPGGNVATPINVSATAQTKLGDLTINGVLKTLKDTIVNVVTIKGDGSMSTNLNSDELDDYHAADLLAQAGAWPTVKQWGAPRGVQGTFSGPNGKVIVIGTLLPLDAGNKITLTNIKYCAQQNGVSGGLAYVWIKLYYSSGNPLVSRAATSGSASSPTCINVGPVDGSFYGSITSIALEGFPSSNQYSDIGWMEIAGFEY